MPSRPLVLASASPARLRLLRDAGFDPVVVVSDVDESAVHRDDPADLVLELARCKATAVLERGVPQHALVVGCDSLLALDGEVLGKPVDAADATARWSRMRGRSGTLLTGHWVCDSSTGSQVGEVGRTVVRFGTPSDDEVAAYVASGEPLHVAGAFTLDGRSASFVDGVDGCPSNVIGLSLPVLRALLGRLDVSVPELWR